MCALVFLLARPRVGCAVHVTVLSFFLSRIALGRKYWRWSFTLVVFVFPREEGFESERAGSGRKLVRVRNARFEIWLLLAKPGRAGGRASGALSSTAEMGRVVSSAVRVVRKRTTIGGAGRQFPPEGPSRCYAILGGVRLFARTFPADPKSARGARSLSPRDKTQGALRRCWPLANLGSFNCQLAH